LPAFEDDSDHETKSPKEKAEQARICHTSRDRLKATLCLLFHPVLPRACRIQRSLGDHEFKSRILNPSTASAGAAPGIGENDYPITFRNAIDNPKA
jgi:hypothetical protein